MSRDTKKVIRTTAITEYRTLEKYFQNQALKGWMLSKINSNSCIFKKINPRELTFSVNLFYPLTPFDYPDYDEEKYYRELCQESGWEFCTSNQMYQIFYKEKDTDAIPIHTDSKEEYRIIKNTYIKTQLIVTIMYIVAIIMGLNNFFNFTYSDLFSNLSLFNCISLIFLLIVGLLIFLPSLIWLVRNKINIINGRELTFISYKTRVILNWILWGFFALYLIGLVSAFDIGSSNLKFIVLMIFFTVVSIILGRYCANRIRTKKQSRQKNIRFVLIICIGVPLVFVSVITLNIMNIYTGYRHNDAISDSVAVLKLSDFNTNSNKDGRIRTYKSSSVFVPIKIDYYESLGRKAKENEVMSVETTYIECKNKRTADFIFNGYLDEEYENYNKRNEEYRKYGEIEKIIEIDKYISEINNELWNVDIGYFLTDKKSEIILQHNNKIYILRGDIDFSRKEIIDICKEKLRIIRDGSF